MGSPDLDQPTDVTIACGCKRTLRDNAITTEPRYGFWRSMTLLFGVTAAPQRIDYVCMACGKTAASTRDVDVIKKHTH
ncbi:MAG: hypothetical protein U1F43_29840 [Myxococcota bacterium]